MSPRRRPPTSSSPPSPSPAPPPSAPVRPSSASAPPAFLTPPRASVSKPLFFSELHRRRAPGDYGICGSLRAAEPADACAPVRAAPGSGGMAFLLIARGNCSFEGKVRAAQRAGFDAALVHDDEVKSSLYSKFHVECIDPWLTKWGGTFGPVCKLEVTTVHR